ncbi:hypothetical protein HanPSC8_Chr04g0186321 [Helianthus annuus]|nr:hypothetical protein HanPSC8_Chr04g0186321 [Helianthus annuus]
MLKHFSRVLLLELLWVQKWMVMQRVVELLVFFLHETLRRQLTLCH